MMRCLMTQACTLMYAPGAFPHGCLGPVRLLWDPACMTAGTDKPRKVMSLILKLNMPFMAT